MSGTPIFFGGKEIRVDYGENTAEAIRQASRAAAEAAAAASSAAFAEGFSGPVYDTQGAGEAATSAGQVFRVDNGDGTLTPFLRTAGGSSELEPLATSAELADTDGWSRIGTPGGLTVGDRLSLLEGMDGAQDIETVRAALRRTIGNRRIFASGRLREIASATFAAAGVQTTDGSDIRVYRPDGSGAYDNCWIRDFVMTAERALEFFPAAEILAGWNWYASFVNQSTWEVPDSINKNGTAVWKPAGNTLGSRAPTDGNPLLVTWAWLHYVKTGLTTIYAANKAFLRSLLDELPYDATTKGVTVSAGSEWVSWGFIDSWKINGTVTYNTVLVFKAYRQYADMAAAAGDFAEAAYALARAEEIKAAFNDYATGMFANSGAPETGSNGLFRFSNGTLSAGQLDIWASAEAVLCDFATPETALAIATSFVLNLGTDGNGVPNFLDRGGVRHVYTTNEFTAGNRLLEGDWGGTSQYGLYQNGAHWMTPLPGVVYAIGLLRPDAAMGLVNDAVKEIAIETRRDAAVAAAPTHASTAAGIAAVEDGEYFFVGSQAYRRRDDLEDDYESVQSAILPAEWVSRDPKAGEGGFPSYGNGIYMTSIAALLGIPAPQGDASLATALTIPAANQNITADTPTRIDFTRIVFDMIGARDVDPESIATVSGGEIEIPFNCKRIEVEASVRLQCAATPGEVLLFAYLTPPGGSPAPEGVLADQIVPSAGNFSLSGRIAFREVVKGTKVSIWAECEAQDITVQNLDAANPKYSLFTVHAIGEEQAV